MSAQPPIDELLRHRAFLRALAERLVGDAARAEDVVQDTLVLALERPPRPGRSLRGWLARVLRHLAWREARAETRRVARERRAARPESVEELVDAGLHAEQRLVAEVAGLDEPSRTVVVLRYHHDLSPAEIAERLGVPIATVKTRLRRALARLRERLGTAPDGRRTLAALALLAAPRTGVRESVPTATTIGGFVMSVKAVTAAIVTAGVLVLAWAVFGADPPGTLASPPIETSAEANAPLRGFQASEAPAHVAARTRIAAEETTVPGVSEAAAAATRGNGLVLDLDGQPVPRVPVDRVDLDGEPTARVETDELGRFPLEGPAGNWSWRVETDELTSVLEGLERREGIARRGDDVEPLVVVARAVDYAGRVVDADGEPVAGSLVSVYVPETWSAGLARTLEGGSTRDVRTTTDDAGRFRLRAPVVPGAMIQARDLSSHVYVGLEAPAATTLDLELVLPAPRAAGRPLAGVVLDPGGRPVEGAIVQLRWSACATDADGRFVVDVTGVETGVPLRVVARGYQLLEVPDPADQAAEPGWPAEIVVRLAAPALAIAGRVVGADGAPLTGRDVVITDPSEFGLTHKGSFVDAERLMRDLDAERASTDDQGRFRLTGLQDRVYTVAAHDPDTLGVASLAVHAGTRDVELVLADDEPRAGLVGVVRAPDGTPLPGVTVTPERPLVRRPSPDGGSMLTIIGAGVRTDAEGRFELPPVPLAVNQLSLEGPEVIPATWFVPDGADRAALEVRTARRARLQLVVGPRWSSCDRFAVRDLENGSVTVWVFDADFYGSQPFGLLTDGRSAIYAVEEGRVAEIVLLEDCTEVHRQRVELDPGRVTVLRVD